MNRDLYRALVDLRVFPEPADDLAHIYDGGDYLTREVLTAFRAHVHETDNIAIAVRRLRNRILSASICFAKSTLVRPHRAIADHRDRAAHLTLTASAAEQPVP